MLQSQYCNLIEERDLYWIQQLVIELKIPPEIHSHRAALERIVLREVKMIIHRIEKSLVYLRHWSKSQGWNMDFFTIEYRYHFEQRSDKHPCHLLQPYVVEFPVELTEEYPDECEC